MNIGIKSFITPVIKKIIPRIILITPEKFKKKWLGIHTPIKNLYLVGADSLMLGLLPAMMSGALAYGVIEGIPLNLMRVFRNAMKYSKSINMKE